MLPVIAVRNDSKNSRPSPDWIASDDEHSNNITAFGTDYTIKVNKKKDIKNNTKANNIQRNESLDNYRSLPQILLVSRAAGYDVKEYSNDRLHK